MQMQVIKQNAGETMQCKFDMQRGNKTRVEKPIKTTQCECKTSKGDRKQRRKILIYMHEKTGRENNACSASDKQ